jgi:C4-dicarboxylate-specific signal transduction histidine kinase
MLVWQVAQHTVAALGHEINQPLASASILCEAANRMLRTQAQTDEARAIQAQRLANTLQRIASDIDRAGSVLRNLLKSVQQPDITRASVMVNDMLAESIHSAREEGVYNYPITIDDAADLPTVHVNRVQVVKVLLNLIHNAAQAMHEAQIDNGTIWINTTLTPDGRAICVTVRDEGPGVSATLQQEIFQPFITTKSSGLGMGLTISVALIEAQGGKLWHTQEGGRGAAFHFTLPISV